MELVTRELNQSGSECTLCLAKEGSLGNLKLNCVVGFMGIRGESRNYKESGASSQPLQNHFAGERKDTCKLTKKGGPVTIREFCSPLREE